MRRSQSASGGPGADRHVVNVDANVGVLDDSMSMNMNMDTSSSSSRSRNMSESEDADADAAIMRNIASFLTFSDADSFASGYSLHSQYSQHSQYSHTSEQQQQQQHNVSNNNNNNDYQSEDVEGTPSGSASGSWAIGVELQGGTSGSPGFWSTSVATPITPALVTVSPGATPHQHREHNDHESQDWVRQHQQQQQYHQYHQQHQQHEDEEIAYMQNLLHKRRREWAQEKLAAAVFSHPRSLRSFCWEAYVKAKEIRTREQQRQLVLAAAGDESDPETLREPHHTHSSTRKRRRSMSSTDKQQQQGNTKQTRMHAIMHAHLHTAMHVPVQLLHELIDFIFHNVPLSVLLDVIEAVTETSLDTTLASIKITLRSMNAVLSATGRLVRTVWDGVVNFNPFALLEAIISLQFNAMGKTSGVLVSGIQSVATGVGSASSLALHRLSSVNPSHRQPSSSSLLLPGVNDGHGSLRSRSRRRNRPSNTANNNSSSSVLNKKLLKKLSTINAAARVVAYTEIQDDTGGLNQYARSRVQRMLHYDVSLRPFVATVSVKDGSMDNPLFGSGSSRNSSSTPAATTVAKVPPSEQDITDVYVDADADALSMTEDDDNKVPAIIRPNSPAWDISSSSSGSPIGSSFMCTPQSFPPTPHSRSMVIARGNRFSDDVIFLARDQLRVHGGLESENERTREMARLLREGKSLAVFDAKDAPVSGIELTCGQHIAAKVGNMMYCGTRSMVPVLRNCWVYFEMLVIPRPVGNIVVPASVATLSIGLSTGEMPPNTLVGAWQGSVGLCSTGQILMAGQLCTPVDSSMSAYTDSATVGCLVCLDDDSAFETWDGVMVTAGVIFSVNGVVVSPPLSTLSVTGRPGTLRSASSVQRGLMDARLGDETMESNNRSGPGIPSASLPLLVPAAEDLYPTVTLHSPASAVMCRFSAEDVSALSRESIGAPPDVTVYAVDGSVIEFGNVIEFESASELLDTDA